MPSDLPPHAALLRDFANTLDVETGSDSLTTVADLTGWLHEHGLLARSTRAGTDDLVLARQLRDDLRNAMLAHHGDEASPHFSGVAAAIPLTVALDRDQPRLRPAATGVRGALAGLLVAVVDAAADGTWERLKICPADDCRWSFYDASKNRSRTWCAMRVCGNRAKTRTYRARHAAAT